MQNLINENSLKAKGLQTTYMRSDIGQTVAKFMEFTTIKIPSESRHPTRAEMAAIYQNIFNIGKCHCIPITPADQLTTVRSCIPKGYVNTDGILKLTNLAIFNILSRNIPETNQVMRDMAMSYQEKSEGYCFLFNL